MSTPDEGETRSVKFEQARFVFDSSHLLDRSSTDSNIIIVAKMQLHIICTALPGDLRTDAHISKDCTAPVNHFFVII